MKEHEEILLGGMFRPTEQNCPTREGELIESLDKIHDIPNPRVGMRVYVENTGKEYIIKSLKEKTIGGVIVPGAVVHEFEESDRLLKGDIEVLRQRAVDIRNSGIAGINADTLSLKFASLENSVTIYDIPAATPERAGVMSAKDKRKLEAVGATKIVWDASSNMNDFKTPGVYDIYGERTRQDDNLPILNASSGHSIAARLTVVASTLQPANNEICVTQFLQLSNRVGGEGATYVRTYNKNNNSMNGWSAWQKQMGMVETYMNGDNYGFGFGKESDGIDSGVGLHYFIDNGIYSGVYVDDKYILGQSNTPSFIETFVLVVINDYAASGQAGLPRHITQLKYAVDAITGQSTVKKRVGTGNYTISWSDWEDIGGGGVQEVDITDAVMAYGLPTLIAQGLAKEGVTYKASSKNIGDFSWLEKLDVNGKIWGKLHTTTGGVDSKMICLVKIISEIVVVEIYQRCFLNEYTDSAYLHYHKFIMDISCTTVKVSADMTTL